MGTPIYSVRNLLADANSISLRSLSDAALTDAAFPVRNLYDGRPGTVCRFSRLSAGRIVVRLGGSTPPKVAIVGVCNHNLPSDATGAIYSSDDGKSWSFRVGLGADHFSRESFAVRVVPETTRYWMIQITNVGSTFAAPQFGEVWIGDAVQLTRNVEWGGSIGAEYVNVTVSAFSGHETTYHVSERRLYEGEAPRGLTAAERDDFLRLYRETKGGAASFLFVPDGDSVEAWIGKLRDPRYAPRSIGPGRYEGIPLNIHEAPWARPSR